MLRLSVNLLTNLLSLLHEIKSYDVYSLRKEVVYYQTFSVSIDSMMEMAEKCGWISGMDIRATLTSTGCRILEQTSYGLTQDKLRLMLADYILQVQPIWRNRIPYGRKEASIFMSKDERACFFEAGLLEETPTLDVIAWWDKLASEIRKAEDTHKLNIGREGERLTLEYEKNRTTHEPQWVSIDSNLSGFDIISRISSTDDHQLLIEVKTSSSTISFADFFISKNEWNVAISSTRYRFYLWHLDSGIKKLAILSAEELRNYIPINQSAGQWESVKIPFSYFENKFKEVNF